MCLALCTLAGVHTYECVCASENVFLPVSLHWRTLEERENVREKGEEEKNVKAKQAARAKGRLPDAEVCAAGVVAADGGHSARVRAYVT